MVYLAHKRRPLQRTVGQNGLQPALRVNVLPTYANDVGPCELGDGNEDGKPPPKSHETKLDVIVSIGHVFKHP